MSLHLRTFACSLPLLVGYACSFYACSFQDVSLGADPSDGSDGSADGSGSGGSGAVTNDSGSADAKPDASDVPCWGLTQPLPDPQTTAEHSCNAIIKSDLANLDHLFGAYANGEIAGFEGALTVLEGGSPTALSGTALAQIVRLADDPVGPAWALQLTVPGSKRWIQVLQYDANPDTLVVGDISEYCCVAPPSETSGVSAPAGGIDLGAPGSSLTLDLSALPPDGGAPHPSIAISANLTRLASVPPTFALEFEAPGTFDFAVEGDEIVRHRSDWNINFATDAPPQFQGWGCGWSTVYSLDQYVKLDEPSVRGVRNVILQKGEFCCATDCVNEHCATGVCCAERESCQPNP